MILTPCAGAAAVVRLEPLCELHREPLRAHAADPAIWRHWPRAMSDWDEAFDWQMNEHAEGRWILHTVIWKQLPPPLAGEVIAKRSEGGAISAPSVVSRTLADASPASGGGDSVCIGQTCYLAIAPEHARVEIGGTWYAPAAQGSRVNPACKLLMLGHAFACGAERVELKTDALNARSRAAMLKMGAQFEGVHRHHMRRPDGTWRDTAWFSVLRAEWPGVKAGLEARLAAP